MHQLVKMARFHLARIMKPKKPQPPKSLIEDSLNGQQPQANVALNTSQVFENQNAKILLRDENLIQQQNTEMPAFHQNFPELYLNHVKQEMLINEIVGKSNVQLKNSMGSQANPQRLNDDRSFENKLQNQYSKSLIEEATKQKDNEMSYFKDLIVDDKQSDIPKNKSSFLHRRISKNQTFHEALQQQSKEKKLRQAQREKQSAQRALTEQNRHALVDSELKGTKIIMYQDDQYYKKKAMREFNTLELRSSDDVRLFEEGERDLDHSSLEMMMMDTGDLEEQLSHKQQIFDQSSFGKHQAKMADLAARIRRQGIQFDMEQWKGFDKYLLFDDKKQRELALEHQKRVLKNEKKRKMKELIKKIHKEKLREDLNFEANLRSRFKDPTYDPLDIEGNFEKVKQINQQRESAIMPKQRATEIHFTKTQKNLERFILHYFHENYSLSERNIKIGISEIKYNEKKTVVHIFWQLQSTHSKDEIEPIIAQIQGKLKRSSSYISGRMTQLLGLRYGPDIRFYYDRILSETEEIKTELYKNKEAVIEFEIQNLKKKGFITNEKEEKQARSKLESAAIENISKYHNRDKLLNLKSIKKNDSKKPKPKASPRKRHASQKLWETIDKL